MSPAALRPALIVVTVVATGLAGALGVACGSGSSTGGGASSSGSSSGGSSGGGTGCAAYPNAVFCDDFEHETDASFAANWPSAPYATNPQFVVPAVVESPTAYSPTHVLHADAEFATDAGNAGQRFSEVGRGLPTLLATQGVSVGFSVRIVSFVPAEGGYESGPSPDFQIVFSALKGQGPSCLVQFQGKDPTHYWVSACDVLQDGGYPTASVAFTPGAWQRLVVSASFGATDAGTGTVTVTADGALVLSVPMGKGAATATEYGGTLTLGSFGYDQTPSMVMDLDDVVIEQK
jgi:hypothetical protein